MNGSFDYSFSMLHMKHLSLHFACFVFGCFYSTYFFLFMKRFCMQKLSNNKSRRDRSVPKFQMKLVNNVVASCKQRVNVSLQAYRKKEYMVKVTGYIYIIYIHVDH